jgi:hypothetical protein
MADAQEAIEQIRVVLADGAGDRSAGADKTGPGTGPNPTRGTK